MRPNNKCGDLVNLETRGKNYTSNKDLCVKDSCKLHAQIKLNLFVFLICSVYFF